MGIVPPPKERAAATLLRYIFNGGDRSGERIAIVIAAQQKYLGKAVLDEYGRPGTVSYLFWQHLGIKAKMRSSRDHRYGHPLAAMVKWKGETSMRNLSKITLVEEGAPLTVPVEPKPEERS